MPEGSTLRGMVPEVQRKSLQLLRQKVRSEGDGVGGAETEREGRERERAKQNHRERERARETVRRWSVLIYTHLDVGCYSNKHPSMQDAQ